MRILPPVQGTQVRSLVWEDPTCLRATKSRYTATEPVRKGQEPRLLTPARLEPAGEVTATRSPHPTGKRSPCSPQLVRRRKEDMFFKKLFKLTNPKPADRASAVPSWKPQSRLPPCSALAALPSNPPSFCV